MVYRDVLEDDAFDVLEFGIRRRLDRGEELPDVISFVTEVAVIRAERRERRVDGFEVSLVAAAFCWWPLKPKPPEAYESFAHEMRGGLLRSSVERGVEYWQRDIPDFIVSSGPEELMTTIST